MDELIRSRMHEALDVEQPHGDLRARVISSLPADVRHAHGFRGPGREWTLGGVAVILAVAVVAGLLYTRPPRATIPSGSGLHATARGGFAMVTPSIGWAIGPAAHVFRTTDGGLRWRDVTPADYSSNSIDTYFLDGNHAWLTQYVQSSSSTVVFGTNNGGASWHRSLPISTADLHRTYGTVLFFIDPTHGWLLVPGLVGGSQLADPSTSTQFEFLYRTTDGGAHWQQVSHTTSRPGACVWGDVVFSSLTTGWIVNFCPSGSGPALFVSHDGGVTWNVQSLPVPATSLDSSPVFFDSQHGILVVAGESSMTLLATSDGGRTWSVRPLPGTVQTGLNFVDEAHGWVIGGSSDQLSNGATVSGVVVPLFRTDDGGNNWVAVRTDLLLVSTYGRVQALDFVDPRNGFAIAFTAVPIYGSFAYQGALLKTTDGGVTWAVVGQLP
ncbi:MAG TPA: hypothetical protein VLR46_01495 [Candidatus Dormibacteraeota bacterium]|nr:hypothetical protein [Candidatus Dormibacteraeota bacterium]